MLPHKELTSAEAQCYWQNYPNAKKSIEDQGLAPTVEAASFMYNYNADMGT